MNPAKMELVNFSGSQINPKDAVSLERGLQQDASFKQQKIFAL